MPEVRRLSIPLRLVAAAAVVFAGLLGGCASPQAKTADFNAQFASGKYSEAYENSSKVAGSLKATNRDQAALVAGLSARSLGRTADAKKWLTPLVANADAGIAGKACVALGSYAQEEHRHLEAADLFTRAGSRLPGDDAAHAYMCAGDSYRALHKTDQAAASYKLAQSKVSTDKQLKIEIADRLAGHGPSLPTTPSPSLAQKTPTSIPPSQAVSGRYTVQTGAFSTLKKAKTEAKRYQAHGPTKAIPITDHAGNTLYAVQVGRYATKQDAERVRQALGNGAIVAEVVD
jgi:hypothetical protein